MSDGNEAPSALARAGCRREYFERVSWYLEFDTARNSPSRQNSYAASIGYLRIVIFLCWLLCGGKSTVCCDCLHREAFLDGKAQVSPSEPQPVILQPEFEPIVSGKTRPTILQRTVLIVQCFHVQASVPARTLTTTELASCCSKPCSPSSLRGCLGSASSMWFTGVQQMLFILLSSG